MLTDINREKYRKELTQNANGHYVVCEVLRLIYDKAYEVNDMGWRDEVEELLVDAFIMVKKMDRRLQYYKNTYKDKTGGGGRKIPRLNGARFRQAFRRARSGR